MWSYCYFLVSISQRAPDICIFHQEGTDADDVLTDTIEAVDGNVVVAGYTSGSWSNIDDGWNDVAVAKLNVDDGEVIWSYQVG